MKRVCVSGLFVFVGMLSAVQGQMAQGETPVVAPTRTAPGTATPAQPAAARPTGIVIVPTLERPKNPQKIEEQDMAGYLLVYFKDQTQSAYMAISRDGYTFTDVNGGEPVFDGKLLAE